MRTIKNTLLFFAVLLLLILAGLLWYNTNLPLPAGTGTPTKEVAARLCAQFQPGSRYNDEVAFYADLQEPSGRYRFYVLDLKEKKVLHRGMVLNGKEKDGDPVYSNVPGSKCSSHGLARVGYRYHGRFGKAYKLVGLESTNSNMMARAVVLHSWRGVPNIQVPLRLPTSEGCPTVSPKFLETLSTYIESSKKPILMYIN